MTFRPRLGAIPREGRPSHFCILCRVERLQRLFVAAGESPERLLLMLYDPRDYFWTQTTRTLPDLKDYLAANIDRVIAATPQLEAKGLVRLIEDLGRSKLADGPYQRFVFDIAAGTAKGPATAARTALRSVPLEALLTHAEAAFANRDSAVRRGAAEVLALIAGPAAAPVLAARQQVETSKPVLEALAALITQMSAAPAVSAVAAGIDAPDGSLTLAAIDGSVIVIPPVPQPPPDTPLPPSAMAPLRGAVESFNAAVEKRNREGEAAKAAGTLKWFQHTQRISDDALERAFEQMNGAGASGNVASNLPLGGLVNPAALQLLGIDEALVSAFYDQPEVTLWHAARQTAPRLSQWFSPLTLLRTPATLPERLLARHFGGADADIRTLIDMLTSCRPDIARDWTLRRMVSRYQQADDEPLPATLQLYVMEHLEVFEEAFGVRQHTSDLPIDELAALRLLGRLDKIPERLLHPLLAIALTSRKAARALARDLLAAATTIDDAIVARLADPKKEVRATAADWLGDRQSKAAADALRKALKKEKAEQPRAAMLSALARIGCDISAYFDEKALRAEADAGLAKTTSKGLDWFPFNVLPTVRWSSGAPVAPDIVRWWIVLADKLEDPAGNALFELYLDRCEPADAQALGVFILKTFVERDTTTCSDAEANAAGEQAVQNQKQWWANLQARATMPAWAKEPDLELAFKQARAQKLAQHLYSAADSKGILGLAVRAPGPDAAALVRAYVKEHGNKVSQTKALLASLARNPAPSAIQVVLAVANRAKQKSTQAYAGELIADLADRRGWSPDELADRTIPTGGFDEAGELALDCGPDRVFRAVYRGDGKVELLNPAGKAVKALPAPRGEEDNEAVALAKKQFSAARKEVKQTEAAQQQRLYEAMCVGRRWPLELWTSCLARHPIASPLCQRLVWQGLDGDGKVVVMFRLLQDGSLTDPDDNQVATDGLSFVRLAHRALMSEAEAELWVQHLRDYEVAALFPQLDRPMHAIDVTRGADTAIKDREGFMIDALKLKGVATKLGYQTGEVGDGGSYMDYVKGFNGVGLRVSIGFTGSYMGAGIEKIAAALTELTFHKSGGRWGRPVKLADVPPVLISEAIADLHAIAAAGTGFAADWQKIAHF